MRLVTYSQGGQQRIGVVDGQEVVDISSVAPNMIALVELGQAGLDAAAAAAKSGARAALDSVKLLSPFPRPLKNVLCLGLNYREHVAEGFRAGSRDSADAPTYPVWFTKAVTSVCGPYDDIVAEAAVSDKYDWEVELALVIGKTGRHISKEKAFEYIHSYTVFNDFSVRDVQRKHGGQFFKGKSMDKSSPMGPWLMTPDELGDPEKLDVECRVNGEVKQSSNTSLMIFDIATSIADISNIMTLEPGDIISTGTPSGVGFARTPPEYLKAGDVMETEVKGLGVLRNRIVAG
jgi:2-keto-4-pentenoate hydratase/2-oxohepta-3-ene-1,7-dioic acid hydratase in catechol pathway